MKNLKKLIKDAVFRVNHGGKSATYEDVIKMIPGVRYQTIERLMRKMRENGELKSPAYGKYVLPRSEMLKEPKKLGEFV